MLRAPANRFITFSLAEEEESPEMPTGHRFSTGHFQLAADEGLLVTFKPADVPYWGISLTNYWFEAISYADHRSHLNNSTVQYQDDGSVRVIIASQDPGQANWIDTQGHLTGTMMLRWSRTNLPMPEIESQVVKLADLK
jgi:hypothetical protein